MTQDKPARRIDLPEEIQRILTEGGVEFGEWYVPATGAQAEEQSLRAQMRGVVEVLPIPEAQRIQAITEVAKHYPTTSLTFEDAMSMSNMISCIQCINPDASPGYPFGLHFTTNAEVMGNPIAFNCAIQLAWQRVRVYSQLNLTRLEAALKSDPTWAVRHNLADPLRLFIKKAPVSAKKAAERRWRLINSLSLVDQLSERLLFSVQDNKEIDSWAGVPSKSGMGLTDHQVQIILNYAYSNQLNVSNDSSAWDIKAFWELIRMECESRILLNTARDPKWENAVRVITLLHEHRILMLTDGTCYKRTILGGQASGRKVTASTNGRARGILDILIGQQFGFNARFMTMGDDNVSWYPEHIDPQKVVDFVESRYGVKLTDMIRDSKYIHFCSQTMFVDEDECVRCVPEKPQVQLANLAMNIKSPGRQASLESLAVNLRHHPQKEAYLQAARQLVKSA